MTHGLPAGHTKDLVLSAKVSGGSQGQSSAGERGSTRRVWLSGGGEPRGDELPVSKMAYFNNDLQELNKNTVITAD